MTASTTSVHVLSKFMQAVANGESGYSFGTPERVTPDALSTIVPILRETTRKRQYVLLSEVQDKVLITDTGSINKMRLRNTSNENVFVRSGTIFRGSTQERTLTRSAILFPNKEVELDVRCVHASRGINRGAEVHVHGFTPLSMDQQVYGAGYTPKGQHHYWNSVKSYSAETIRTCGGTVPAPTSDGTVTDFNSPPLFYSNMPSPDVNATPVPTPVPWSLNQSQHMTGGGRSSSMGNCQTGGINTSNQNIRLGANKWSVPTQHQAQIFDTNEAAAAMRQGHHVKLDDLASSIDGLASNLDALLSKVKRHDHQVGFGLITEKGLQCIELFDVDESWSAIHTDAVNRVGTDLARKDVENTFEFKPRVALNTLAAVLAGEYTINKIFEHKPSNGEPTVRIFGLTSDKYVGEAVELDGRVMHLSLIRFVA